MTVAPPDDLLAIIKGGNPAGRITIGHKRILSPPRGRHRGARLQMLMLHASTGPSKTRLDHRAVLAVSHLRHD